MAGDLTISFVVPVYNVERIRERFDWCINSLLAQTWQHTEIILVNDASTDNTADILQQLKAQHTNIKVITHSHNQGQGPARNTGVMAASGDYIWFIDQDDYVAPNACEVLAPQVLAFNRPSLISFQYVDTYDSPNTSLMDTTIHSAPKLIDYSEYNHSIRQRFMTDLYLVCDFGREGAIWRRIIQSDLARSVKFPALYPEDNIYMHEIVSRVNRILFLDTKLYCWCRYPESTSSTYHLKENAIGHIKAFELMRAHAQQYIASQGDSEAGSRAPLNFFRWNNAKWAMVTLSTVAAYATSTMDTKDDSVSIYLQTIKSICPDTWCGYWGFVGNYAAQRTQMSLRRGILAPCKRYHPSFIIGYVLRMGWVTKLVLEAAYALLVLKIHPTFFVKQGGRHPLNKDCGRW